MDLTTEIDRISKRNQAPLGRLIFGYILLFPNASTTDTSRQISILTAETTDFLLAEVVGHHATGSPPPAFDVMLCMAAPGDVVLIDAADRLGPLLEAFTTRLAQEGIELIFIDEHYEAGRGL